MIHFRRLASAVTASRLAMCIVLVVLFGDLPHADAAQATPPPSARPADTGGQGIQAPPELTPATLPPTMQGRGEPTLTVGDPAPPLDVRGFIVGAPMAAHGEGPVRLLLFWSTICWPCRGSIPDVASLVKRYGDQLQVISVAADTDDAVANFIETTPWGGYIDYRVAIDREQSTQNRYLHASGRPVLPMAFIIGREGIIEWLGSPRDMDDALASIVAGTWDRAEGIAAVERRRAFDRLHGQLGSAFIDATNAEDWDRVLELIARLEAADPTATAAPTERFRVLLVRSKRVNEGYEAARELLQRFPRDASILHRAARMILETPDLEPRDTALAYELAYRASEQLLHEHASFLATLAAAHEANGRLAEAVQTMITAVDRAESRVVRNALNDILTQWQSRLATGDTAPAPVPASSGRRGADETEQR